MRAHARLAPGSPYAKNVRPRSIETYGTPSRRHPPPRGVFLAEGRLMRLRVGAATDRGRVREMNEDVYGVRLSEGLFVVCDGMGGCLAGEVASRMAVETILQQLDDPAHEGA